MPRLMINDTPFLPIIFFYNTDIPGYGSGRYMKEQVTLAAQAGVHLYSLPLRHRRMKGGERIDFADSDALMDAFIQIDSQALFILRLFVGPHGSWKEWNDIPAEEFQHHKPTCGQLCLLLIGQLNKPPACSGGRNNDTAS